MSYGHEHQPVVGPRHREPIRYWFCFFFEYLYILKVGKYVEKFASNTFILRKNTNKLRGEQQKNINTLKSDKFPT